jgi:hypothetical protein
MDMQRRTFPTTVKALDGRSAPTEAELDRMLFELVNKVGPDATDAAGPETRRVPTDAELRARCAELGLRVPARNPDAVWLRNLFPAMGRGTRRR